MQKLFTALKEIPCYKQCYVDIMSCIEKDSDQSGQARSA